MDNTPPQDGLTLGTFLEDARQEAGCSIRQLEAATKIPRTTITQLLKDRVEKPNPDHLMRIAHALELNAANVFLHAGLPLPDKPPTIEAMLRTEYGLPEKAIAEAQQQIQAIVDKYNHERANGQQ